MQKKLLVAALVAGLQGVAGCGGGGAVADVETGCNEIQSATCERWYTCFTQEERDMAGYPATEAECDAMLQEDHHCSQLTAATACAETETYHGELVDDCATAIHEVTCTQLHQAVLISLVPVCKEVCASK